MQLIEVPTVKYARYQDSVYLHHFTDIHMGAEGCDEKQLTKDIAKIIDALEDGGAHYLILGGDNINGIGVKDKRHDPTAVAKRFKKWEGDDLFRRQADAVTEAFDGVKDRILFVGDGNHERTVATSSEFNPTAYIAQALDVPYAGYCAGFRLRLEPRNRHGGTHVVTGLWHHGFGAARTKGGKANLGPKLQEVLNADLTLTGHVHEPMGMPGEELDLTRSGKLRLVARDKLVVIGASYLKTYPTTEKAQEGGCFDRERAVRSDYGERFGFRPAVIGHVGCSMTIDRGNHSGYGQVKLRFMDFR